MDATADSTTIRLTDIQRELERPPFNKWLGAIAVSADETIKSIVVSVQHRRELDFGPAGDIFHGGVIAAIADVVGYASVAIWSCGPTPTIALQVEYLAPARGPELIVKAGIRRLGRVISRSDIEFYASGKLVALARASFSMPDSRK
jgi:uncharacterized protein (TIGR00369 family)